MTRRLCLCVCSDDEEEEMITEEYEVEEEVTDNEDEVQLDLPTSFNVDQDVIIQQVIIVNILIGFVICNKA